MPDLPEDRDLSFNRILDAKPFVRFKPTVQSRATALNKTIVNSSKILLKTAPQINVLAV